MYTIHIYTHIHHTHIHTYTAYTYIYTYTPYTYTSIFRHKTQAARAQAAWNSLTLFFTLRFFFNTPCLTLFGAERSRGGKGMGDTDREEVEERECPRGPVLLHPRVALLHLPASFPNILCLYTYCSYRSWQPTSSISCGVPSTGKPMPRP